MFRRAPLLKVDEEYKVRTWKGEAHQAVSENGRLQQGYTN